MGGNENGPEGDEDTDASRVARISKGNLKQKCLPLDLDGEERRGGRRKGTLAVC